MTTSHLPPSHEPHPLAPEPAPGRADRNGRRIRPGLVLGTLLLAAAAVAGWATLSGGGSDHPDEWDPRVLGLVRFVEDERNLTFLHPVEIDFLPDAEFRAEVTEREELDDEERAQLESFEAMLRAVGLVTGDVDLEEIGDELVGDGVTGLYSFDDERIVVRGDTLDDKRRLTLVHELTHALQDQHFDVGELEPETSGGEAALTAVVEADAQAVEDAWRETLSAEAREAVDREEETELTEADFEGVPDVFVELMSFPYAFGPDFLDAVIEERGAAGRNRLFTEPPTTEEHIILPETYLAEQAAEELSTPALADGEEVIEDTESDFGMLSLLVVLGERIDFATAWGGVQGWAGDAMVAYERGDDTCVRAQVAFDVTAQAERFQAAFEEWAAGLPTMQSRQGRFVTFESCDPGTDVAGRSEDHVSAIQGLALRKAIAQGFESSGAPAEAARCVADGLIERFGANRLAELDQVLVANPQHPAAAEIEATVVELIPRCR